MEKRLETFHCNSDLNVLKLLLTYILFDNIDKLGPRPPIFLVPFSYLLDSLERVLTLRTASRFTGQHKYSKDARHIFMALAGFKPTAAVFEPQKTLQTMEWIAILFTLKCCPAFRCKRNAMPTCEYVA